MTLSMQEASNDQPTWSAAFVGASKSDVGAQDVVSFVEMFGGFPLELLRLSWNNEAAFCALEPTLVQMLV